MTGSEKEASGPVGAVIVAAGRSERMGNGDKLLREVAGRPLLAWSLAVFASHSAVERLVVVASAANRMVVEELARTHAPVAVVVEGGPRRRDSVFNGVQALEGCEIVVVHDGARPLVSSRLIDAAIEGARQTGAALCAVPVADTLKRSTQEGLVSGTVSRQGMYLAQTPQAFKRDLLLQAHAATDIDATDDAELVELIERPVRLVLGSSHNLKVTTPDDLLLVEALLRLVQEQGHHRPGP